MPVIIFETDRLTCRRWVPEDMEPLYDVYSDAGAMRWVGDGTPITRTECERWFEVTAGNYARRGYGMFALVERATQEVIGFAGLVHPDNQADAEVKYALRRGSWGQGFASEAVPELISYGHHRHGLSRIIATVAPGHRASQRVLEKSGMRLGQQRRNDDGSTTLVYEWHAPKANSASEGSG